MWKTESWREREVECLEIFRIGLAVSWIYCRRDNVRQLIKKNILLL
jgi:hypothetical protein